MRYTFGRRGLPKYPFRGRGELDTLRQGRFVSAAGRVPQGVRRRMSSTPIPAGACGEKVRLRPFSATRERTSRGNEPAPPCLSWPFPPHHGTVTFRIAREGV